MYYILNYHVKKDKNYTNTLTTKLFSILIWNTILDTTCYTRLSIAY